MTLKKNDPKTINAWCMYDWANSVHSLTIVTAIFPVYFYSQTGGAEDVLTSFFGLKMKNSVLFSFVVAFSFLFISVLNPLLSGIADFGGKKKGFMRFFSTMGAVSTALLFFFDKNTVELGAILFGLSIMGYAGSLVFYNSYLPEIVTEDKFDKVSAKGFALGYIGSVFLLVLNIVMLQNSQWFGEDPTMPAKVTFVTVGLWWAGFAQITFRRLPANVFNKNKQKGLIAKGFKEFKKVWLEVKEMKTLKMFLLAFFLYSMGVQTIMYMATIFGKNVVKMEDDQMILLVLILQLIAIVGAFLFSYISSKKGNIFSLSWSLVLWTIVCVYAYFLGEGDVIEFNVLAVLVGLVMGGVQAMSRSTYSKLIPAEAKDHASYFSFYETLEKISIALGTFTFGFLIILTGTENASALSLSVFFIVGLVLLLKIPKVKPQDN